MSEKIKVIGRIMDPERRQFWIDATGTDEAPLRTHAPVYVDLPDLGERLAWVLAVEELTEEQQERLLLALAAEFGLDAEEMREEFLRDGVPVLNEDVQVSISIPMRLVM